jgi:hypothetical protein
LSVLHLHLFHHPIYLLSLQTHQNLFCCLVVAYGQRRRLRKEGRRRMECSKATEWTRNLLDLQYFRGFLVGRRKIEFLALVQCVGRMQRHEMSLLMTPFAVAQAEKDDGRDSNHIDRRWPS